MLLQLVLLCPFLFVLLVVIVISRKTVKLQDVSL